MSGDLKSRKRKPDNVEEPPSAKRLKRFRYKTTMFPKSTIVGMDMLFLCGADANVCRPLKYSDDVLDFLKSKKYKSWVFVESIFQTLQQMIPKACFLHPITLYIIFDEFKNLFKSEFKITQHDGKNEESIEDLNFKMYKKNVIDRCALKQGKQNPLMAIPFGLEILNEKSFGHANMLIIDPNNRTCEHFEPHGAEFMRNLKDLNDVIEQNARYFCERMFPGYTYIPRDDATNFQTILTKKFKKSQHSGTCAMWSVWYAFLRLSHPEFTRESIISKSRELLGQNDFAELEHFIVQFIAQLGTMIDIRSHAEKHDENGYVNSKGRTYNYEEEEDSDKEDLDEKEKVQEVLRLIQTSYPNNPLVPFQTKQHTMFMNVLEKVFSAQSKSLAWVLVDYPFYIKENAYSFKFGAAYALLLASLNRDPYDYVYNILTDLIYFKKLPAAAAAAAADPPKLVPSMIRPVINDLLTKITRLISLSDTDLKQICVLLFGGGYEKFSNLDEDSLKLCEQFIQNFERDNIMHLGMLYVLLLKVCYEYYGHATGLMMEGMYIEIYTRLSKITF